MIKSGRRTPIEVIPTPDLAVPYAAPKPDDQNHLLDVVERVQVKTMAEVHPIAPFTLVIVVEKGKHTKKGA
jgi:hypothetical protein